MQTGIARDLSHARAHAISSNATTPQDPCNSQYLFRRLPV